MSKSSPDASRSTLDSKTVPAVPVAAVVPVAEVPVAAGAPLTAGITVAEVQVAVPVATGTAVRS